MLPDRTIIVIVALVDTEAADTDLSRRTVRVVVARLLTFSTDADLARGTISIVVTVVDALSSGTVLIFGAVSVIIAFVQDAFTTLAMLAIRAIVVVVATIVVSTTVDPVFKLAQEIVERHVLGFAEVIDDGAVAGKRI